MSQPVCEACGGKVVHVRDRTVKNPPGLPEKIPYIWPEGQGLQEIGRCERCGHEQLLEFKSFIAGPGPGGCLLLAVVVVVIAIFAGLR